LLFCCAGIRGVWVIKQGRGVWMMNKEDRLLVKRTIILGIVSTAFLCFGIIESHAGSVVIGAFGFGIYTTITFQEINKYSNHKH